MTSGDNLPMRLCLPKRVSFIPLQKKRGNSGRSAWSMGVKCPGCYEITTVLAMHKRSFCVLASPLSSASLQEEKQGFQRLNELGQK